jgi:hypothetical protein
MTRFPDKILTGVLIGLLFPPLLFGMVYYPIWVQGKFFTVQFYESMSLFCIGANALLMWIMMNRFKFDNTGKGILVINLAYCIAFVAFFYGN